MKTSRLLPWALRTLLATMALSMVSIPVAVTAAPAATPGPEEGDAVASLTWPRTIKAGANTLTIYQPQVDSWDGWNLVARSAVAVQEPGAESPVFGVIWITANAQIDKAAGVVSFINLKITKDSFPTAPDKAEAYLTAMQAAVPTKPLNIALAQVQNSLEITQATKEAAAQPVQNTPPEIIVTYVPAILLLVDGAPVLQPVAGTDYQRVLNTRVLIAQKTSGGDFYLTALNQWFSAPAVNGPWEPVPTPPAGLTKIRDSLVKAKTIDPVEPPKDKPVPTSLPLVFVSETPAELLQTNGTPQFSPIQDTNLLQVSNSDNAILLDIDTQKYYALISGRWFAAQTLSGPWGYVAGKDLPKQFAKIPLDSDKANVLISVPGTPQAKEAIIANSIPTTATVNRKTTTLTLNYAGNTPVFKPVEGTTLQYAVNTPTPVIQVEPTVYYAVENGVWFTGGSPTGPWVVAETVPPAIYTIPVSSPIHYVTYVRVYGGTPDVVYVGYTPGYMGTVVSDGVVVYGTGYVYPPYVEGPIYVPQPVTYGYGAGFAEGAAVGFAFGFTANAVYGACVQPYWGAYGWGYNHGYNYGSVSVNSTSVYNHWNGSVTGVSRSYGYNSWNGSAWSSASATHFNPYTGGVAAGSSYRGYNSSTGNYGGARGGTYSNARTGVTASGSAVGGANAYTGNYAGTRSGSAYDAQTGKGVSGTQSVAGNRYTGNFAASSSVTHANEAGGSRTANTSTTGNAKTGNYQQTTNRSGETANGAKGVSTKTTTGNAYTGNSATSRSGAAYNPNTGKGAAYHNGNVYAGSDGNVYKKSDNGGWQSNNKSGWGDANKDSGWSNRQSELNRDSAAREGGEQRWGEQRSSGGWGGGGGGYRGGGGFRR